MAELISKAFREHILCATYEDEVIHLCKVAIGIRGDEEVANYLLIHGLTDPDDAREYIASILPAKEAEDWKKQCEKLAKS